MKNKLNLLAICVIAFSIVGCSTLFNSSSNSVATSAGANCGKAISNLYKEYKKENKVDVTNTNTLTYIIQIAAARNVLKENKNDAAFVSAFALGLVSGSNNLITNATSNNVINALLSLSSLNTVTTNTPSSSSTATEAGKAVLPLMRTLDD